ncbi:MAG: hypothetical protein HC939_17090 [Pleurocapsa sp. SU_5_0]|nr:hypothetical protein [Pleurocapsa sp. SU_5_0]NJO97668.1 hypothetical protein [Pleurocapsa sp. CRU_1_2]
MQKSKIKVLYIAGFERSGSTIINRVLGQIDGFVAWGELRDIWLHGIAENRFCTCGETFVNCSAWQRVFDEAFGGKDKINISKIIALQKKTRSMVLPHYFGVLKDEPFKQKVGQYLIDLQKLYRGIQTTTGCKVIVDSSKASWYGYVLGLLPDIDLYVFHIVRNPKGICYSLEQRKRQGEPESQWYNPLHASLSWNLKNYAVEMLLNSSKERYLRTSYKNFIQNPEIAVRDVLDLLNEEVLNLPFIDSSTVEMNTDHIVTGSPSSRSDTGTVKLSLDEKWKQKMNQVDKTLINFFTFPIMKRYF